MLITPSTLQGMFTMFDTRFWQAYQQTQIFKDKLATTITSVTEQNTYGWMGKIPTLREWIGARQPQNAFAYPYTVTNKPFELTMSVDKFKIQDDQYGLYAPIVTEMGWQAAKWPDYRLVEIIQANGTWADGKAFFATDHPVNLYNSAFSTYANEFTTTALNFTNYAAVRQAMMAYKGEDGKPLGIMPNLLIVPPALDLTARHILHSDFIAPATIGNDTSQVGATTNVLKGTADLIVMPELANEPTRWYLADTSRAIKPFIWQLREAPQFAYRISPTDPAVFDLHEFIYGVEARGEAAFGLPWLCARATA